MTGTPRLACEVAPRPGRLERPGTRPPSPRQVLQDLGRDQLVNGLVGLIFSMTGPVAVILSAGAAGGLPQSYVASWVFGVFVFNGLLTIVASWTYRQPLGFFWTIPGTVVVGQALTALTWAEVVGGYLVSAAAILGLGLTGKVDKLMRALPMPVVMAMVAGVFLPFGLGLVGAVEDDVVIAAPMVVVFLLATAVPRLGRVVPPVLGALVTGAVVVVVTGRMNGSSLGGQWVAAPVVTAPDFSWAALGQLVVPLVITVVVVQNGQGLAVLTTAGHRPPMNLVTIACGVVSFPAAAVGAVSTCLTGPTNALLTATGERGRQYTAAIWCGTLAVGFGLVAPGAVRLMLSAPAAFVAALGGLAMLKALQGAFVAAFSGRQVTGALVTFVVTVSGVHVLNIGAAFWGLIAGLMVCRLVDDRAPTTAPTVQMSHPGAQATGSAPRR